ncbi:MAG: IPTL-CTERM sorting domain-containing protein [Planctomycetes bacterium]|nr:IPTL-CTERM sorting domain-containing protein [Planctomycetota bacterium]
MSKCKMSLVVLCVASATLAYPGSAGAQYFEGSGVLRIAGTEPCLLFFPDSGEFPLGLGTLGDWGGFQEGDHIHIAGVLLPDCGGFCTFEGLCFDDNDSVIVAWPIVPTVSEWGMIALGLLVLVAGTILMRSRRRYFSSVGVLGVLLLPALCASSFAQDPLVAQKVERMLQGQHHPTNMLVRFKATASQVARDCE